MDVVKKSELEQICKSGGGILIKTSGRISITDPPLGFEKIKSLIGLSQKDLIEVITLRSLDLVILCDEEGRLKGASFNPIATSIMGFEFPHAMLRNEFLVGDVFVCGIDTLD